jgi:hypothetical protein
MTKDLKLDMPAVLALIIIVSFVVVMLVTMVRSGTVDADFKQTLFAIVMVAVGFYLGSSSDSRKKTDALITPPPASEPAPPAR